MIKLLKLSQELYDNTYPYTTLLCERIIHDSILLDKKKAERLYKELENKTVEYLGFVQFFTKEILPLVPADEVRYLQELMQPEEGRDE